jgi:hypothetical protein
VVPSEGSFLDPSRQARRGAKLARRDADGYQMFFLNTVAVAPNKFRPSSKMGDMRRARCPGMPVLATEP